MLEPQPVAPGYIRRWPIEAWRHVWRHGQAYVLLLALPIVPALFATHDPWRTLAGALLGPFAVRLSFEIAAAAVLGPIAQNAYGAVVRAAVLSMVGELRRNARSIVTLLIGFSLMLGIAASLPGEAPSTVPSNGVERTAALFLPVAAQLFVGLTLVYGIAPASRSLVPLLMRVHGIGHAPAQVLVNAAVRQNRHAFFFVDQVIHGVTFVALIGLHPLAPLALAWLPALVCVAMREIFGPREAQRQAAARGGVSAPRPAPGSLSVQPAQLPLARG